MSLLFSIIIPTYNEKTDLAQTLQHLCEQDYPHKEILVVDESSDETPSIIKSFIHQGVMLYRQKEHTPYRGRSAARNVGIRVAKGEVVVILNADVHLPKSFLSNIAPFYENHLCDYLLVESKVSNLEHLFGRFVQACHEHDYGQSQSINWTEGFSCRKSAALAAGLFPEDTLVPLVAGEDAIFGQELEKRFKKRIERNLVVSHVVPHDFHDFWHQRAGRWKGGVQVDFCLRKKSLHELRLQANKTRLKLFFYILLKLPFKSLKLLSYSPKKTFFEFFALWWAGAIDSVAGLVGMYQGLKELESARQEKDFIELNENEGQNKESRWNLAEKAFFLRFLNPEKNDLILDLGCGNGVFGSWAQDQISCRVVGSDFSKKALKNAQQKLWASSLNLGSCLPFKDCSFDKVFFIETLEHIPTHLEKQTLAEIYRVLKPEGKLILHTSPNMAARYTLYLLNPLVFFANLFGKNKGKLSYYSYDKKVDLVHINKKTPWALKKLIQESGFEGQLECYPDFQYLPRILLGSNSLFRSWPLSWLFSGRMRATLVKTQSSFCKKRS